MNINELQSHSPDRHTQTVSLLILTVIAVGFALYFLRPVLLPLLFALFLYLCLTPLIEFQMRRLHLPYTPALMTTALLGTLLLLLIIAIAAASVSRMAADVTIYQQQLNMLVERISSSIPLGRFGGEEAKSYLRMSEGSVAGFLSAAIYEFSSLISNGVFVVILTVFILIGRGSQQRAGLIGDLESHVQRYISRTVWLSALTGLFVGLTLALLGVRFAMVFGLFAFLLNFIPVIGPVVATLLPLPIVLLSPELSVTAKVLALLIPALIEFLMGQIVSPRMIGRSLSLHPVTVLLFLLFFQMIWGIGGAFMSTPIAAVVKILFDHFEGTRRLAGLMAGDLDALVNEAKPIVTS
jgi:AI-2 transport protein TqsA